MAAEFPVRAKVDDKELDKLIAALRKAGKEADLTAEEIEEIENATKKLGNNGGRHVNGLNEQLGRLQNTVGNAVKGFVALYALDKAQQFLNKTVQITAEFQRLRAVLNNTLGSKSAGDAAFARIQEYASKTPYQVNQITDAFVKLANRGFIPSNKELTSLGDLAASTGKQFNDLVEAILDAQTGEFERLKEFGVTARSEGDKVRLSFKGVTTEVQKTDDAIKDYILSLGELEGVAGATADISETLGGKISNATDSFDRFFANIGNGTSGPMTWLIDKTIEAVDWMNELMASINDKSTREAAKMFEEYREELENLESKSEIQNKIEDLNEKLKEQRDAFQDLNAEAIVYENEANKTGASIRSFLGIGSDYNQLLEEQKEKMFDAGIEIQATEMALDFLARQLKKTTDETKDLNKEMDKVEVPDFLEGLNPRKAAEELRSAIERNFGKGFLPDQEKIQDETLKKFEKHMDDLAGAHKRGLDKQKRDSENHKEWMTDLEQEMHDAFIEIGYNLEEYYLMQGKRRLENLSADREHELLLVGDNEAAKIRINKKFDEEERRLRAEQARREQNVALFNIAINTAAGIAKLWANPGFPAAIPLMALVAATGALQAAVVKSQPTPRFKDGVYGLKGPGTETSDSIPAMLSRDESVVHARASKNFGWLLKPMIEDKAFNDMKLRQLVDANIPSRLRGDIMLTRKESGNDELKEELRQIRKAIEGKPVSHLNIDEHGFNVSIERGKQWTNYVSKRYSC